MVVVQTYPVVMVLPVVVVVELQALPVSVIPVVMVVRQVPTVEAVVVEPVGTEATVVPTVVSED